MTTEPYFDIAPGPETAGHIRKERDRARALKRTAWWQQQLRRGICRYCGRRFPPGRLSMDHIVPLARGGKSTKGNVAPACTACNRKKNLETPADTALRTLAEDPPPS